MLRGARHETDICQAPSFFQSAAYLLLLKNPLYHGWQKSERECLSQQSALKKT